MSEGVSVGVNEAITATKRCNGCGEAKPATEFYPRKKRKSVILASRCKVCERASALRRQRAIPKAESAARMRKWKAANRERWLESRRGEYERKRFLRLVARIQQRAQKMPLFEAAMPLLWRAGMREEMNAAVGFEFPIDIFDPPKPAQIPKPRKPRMTDEERRAAERVRASVRRFAKRHAKVRDHFATAVKGTGRSRLWATLGYTQAELRAHLERQFTKGMNWDRFNAGEIHIDHIIPCKEYDLDSVEELRKCFALPNLRPIWAHENWRKGARRTHLC